MDHKTPDDHLNQVIALTGEMIELASAGDACRVDAGCGIVFGSLRDKAYKLRKIALSELERHRDSNHPVTKEDVEQP